MRLLSSFAIFSLAVALSVTAEEPGGLTEQMAALEQMERATLEFTCGTLPSKWDFKALSRQLQVVTDEVLVPVELKILSPEELRRPCLLGALLESNVSQPGKQELLRKAAQRYVVADQVSLRWQLVLMSGFDWFGERADIPLIAGLGKKTDTSMLGFPRAIEIIARLGERPEDLAVFEELIAAGKAKGFSMESERIEELRMALTKRTR